MKRVWLCLASVLLLALSPAFAFDLVRDGKAVATVVVPDEATAVVQAAAEELHYHVRRASGAELAVVKQKEAPAGPGLVFLGPCARTLGLGLKPEELRPNGFFVRNAGGNLHLLGDDSEGEVFWIQHGNRTRVGTLFAVYEILEKQLGVRWLWPGPLGEVIPRRTTISINVQDGTFTPRFVHTRWRDGSLYMAGTKGWADQKNRSVFLNEQGKWLRRHRFAMGVNMDMAHSFTDWWGRFGQEHPEYFNLLPDGTRRPDPTYFGGDASLVSMSVGEPGVWRQKVADWKARRDVAPFVDASENDTPGKCTCDLCMAMDEPDPGSKVSFDQRKQKAQEAFAAAKDDWWTALGSLSDRYARFYLAVQKEAQKVDPQAVVMGYAYANYVKPPRHTKLNERIIIGIVPALMFPWTAEKRKAFTEQWEGWSAAGARLLLRPNYMLDGHCLPINIARPVGEDFSFAAHHGLIGTDFDSLTGQYATQGPNLYMLARLHEADLKPSEVLAEYYAAFGKAAEQVQSYFEHWAAVTAKVDDKTYETAGLHWSRFYRDADVIFTPEVMRKGRVLLEAAATAAKGDAEAEARVAYLEKGLRNAELVLATQRAYRGYAKTGDYREFGEALQALDEYRATVEGDLVANMAYLAWSESNTWDRSLIKLMTQPGTRLPDPWQFAWDPEKRGETERWFAPEYDAAKWPSIGTSLPWEQQEVGIKWEEAHGADYDGVAWYRTTFRVPAEAKGKRVSLLFSAVDEACQVWLNGKLLLERPYPFEGDTDSWKTPFEVDVTDAVRAEGANVLVVRVEDNAGAGGIWRPVWLMVAEPAAEPGRNLLGDGGFERTPTEWSQSRMCGEFKFTIDTSVRRTGERSGRLEGLALGSAADEKQFGTRAWARYYTTIKGVDPAKRYRFRAWYRTSEDFVGTVRFWVTGTTAGTMEAKGLSTPVWREVRIEDVKPAGAEVSVYLNVMDGTGTVWFDDVEVVEE